MKADWNKIRNEYVHGNISIAKLAEKYNCSLSTLAKISTREKWKDQRQKVAKKTAEKVDSAIVKANANSNIKLYNAADKLLDIVSATLERIAEEEPERFITVYRQLSGTLKDIKDIKSVKSELDLEEQKARIKSLQKQIEAETTDKTVKVVIEGGADYAD